MNELIEKDQIISIVPQNFKNSNKGKVIEVLNDRFVVEAIYSPSEILINNLVEFYSKTDNGVLYFESDVINIHGHSVTIKKPIKHRFLQRRQFTRIKFIQELDFCSGGKSYKINTSDISAGGMKFTSSDALNIDLEYDVKIHLLSEQRIECKFQIIRIEKNDAGFYTLSGRFINLSNIDRMTLIQFCMKKNIENVNRNE